MRRQRIDDVEPTPPSATRRRVAAFGALGGALVVALGLAVLAWAVVEQRTPCASGETRLAVAAAPDIAPAVQQVADTFNAAHHEIDARCAVVAVTARAPVDVMNSLAQEGPVSGQVTAQAWVPDSRLWLDLARHAPGGTPPHLDPLASLARSPVVIAVPRPLASRLARQSGRQPLGWQTLLPTSPAAAPPVGVQLLDPTRNAAGMSALAVLESSLGDDPAAMAKLTGVIRTVQQTTVADPQVLTTAFPRAAAAAPTVTVATEQWVWAYNRARPPVPVLAVYPADGTPSLDYPYVVTTDDARRRRVAAEFGRALAGPAGRAAVQRIGFRAPDGTLGSTITRETGLDPRVPKDLTPTGRIDQAIQAWNRLSLGSRLLALVDVSGSMAATVPGTGISRLQATARTAQEGLALFPDDSEIGLWVFSTNLDGSRDYRELVPIGALRDRVAGQSRRQRLTAALGAVRPYPNGDTGLYDSILAAYREMKRTYRPDEYNTLLVLTDGKNDDPQGISLRDLLAELRRDNDPKRPVQIIAIAFGPDIDPAALNQITRATDGQTYVTRDPTQIRQVFLQALSRRMCAPHCPSR